MMGAACDKSGEGVVKITDMDQIEISNLNRQFLFRKNDVGVSLRDSAYSLMASLCSNLSVFDAVLIGVFLLNHDDDKRIFKG